MQDGQVLALLCVARQEDQGEEELGVEHGAADEGEDGVGLEAFAGEDSGVEGHFGGFFIDEYFRQ